MHPLLKALRNIVTPFLEFVYPPRCLGCGVPIPMEDVICAECFATATEFPVDDETSQAHLGTLLFSSVATMMAVGFEFQHDGIIATCIHTMKYRDLHRIARWFGIVLGERIIDSNFVKGNPALVPVPLHKLRKIERSYNQADYICKGIAWETGLDFIPDALIRVRYTASQAGSQFNKSERRENVLNAFSVNPKHLPVLLGRPVILVDDLITTGATISECGIALEETGVRDIRFLAIARPPVKQLTMDN